MCRFRDLYICELHLCRRFQDPINLLNLLVSSAWRDGLGGSLPGETQDSSGIRAP